MKKDKAAMVPLSTSTSLVLTPEALYQHFFSQRNGWGNQKGKKAKEESYLLAYSGGLDSHVLLHLLVAIRKENPHIRLRSVYVDHGLQEASSTWADHCQQIAHSLAVEHDSIALNLAIPKGESLEAVARKARYQALAGYLLEGEVLLTAQHQDDQAETLLLQLLRGSGLDGLAAMPEESPFVQSYHMRPLLAYSREQLEQYANEHALKPIQDPSNADNRFDRNYLRNEIIPELKKRWPQMALTLSRSARLHAEASQLQATYLDVEMPKLRGSTNKEDTLSVKAIKQLSPIKQKAVLRHWIKQSGFKAPSAAQIEHIIHDVLNSALDAMPLVAWEGAEIRRYKDDVYIMYPLASLPADARWEWDISQPLFIDKSVADLDPADLGELRDILLEKSTPVTVRFRQGGERIKLSKHEHSTTLKNLFQERNIPPWLRNRIPLVFAKNQLIYIPDMAITGVKDLAP
ncbi:MAG TPA: tRNA lysidine(34) synthetase TilS [Thiothrix sp.]|nr:tRNA lysidine(34) synthetase TilS [Thiothrix sp.]